MQRKIMFLRFCKQSSNGDLKKRYSLTNTSKSEKRRTEAEVISSIEDRITEAKSDDDENAIKEDERAVQTVDLVADCPSPVVASRAASPTSAIVSYGTITAATNPTSRESTPSMGQRSSSISLLRPKISLTWVLRNQQHEGFIHSSSPGDLHTFNNQQSTVVGVVEIHREKDTNPAKEREEKEKAFRRSVKSVKSVKSIKSVKSVKNTEDTRNKKKEKENLDRIEKYENLAFPLQRIEKNNKIDKEKIEKETVTSFITDKSEEEYPEKENQMTKENKDKDKDKVKRAISEPNLINREANSTPSGRSEKQHRHRRTKRSHRSKIPTNKFGYDIADLDTFFTKASIDRPANIPVVLSSTSVLYQTQNGTQAELGLPLGTVVNAVFKKQSWLYVQTPHGQEGYVDYSACLPLGILPQSKRGPCWEDPTDVFPMPLGNLTDTEKLQDTRSECTSSVISTSTVQERHPRRTTTLTTSSVSTSSRCNSGNSNAIAVVAKNVSNSSNSSERSVDRLYLQATASTRGGGDRNGVRRHTLLLIREDYDGRQEEGQLQVAKGEVVVLLGAETEAGPEWFWVKSQDGSEGLIPAAVAGHGFL